MTDEEKILDSLEQVNMKIDDVKQMLEVLEPEDVYEEEAKQAFTNVLNRYIAIKNALEKSFKKTFGYFDKGVYTMMTNKFKKLFEFYQQPKVKNLLKEVSGLGVHFKGSDLSDEGLYDFFGSLDDFYRVSQEHAKNINLEVIDLPGKDTAEIADTIESVYYEKDMAQTVTY